MLNQSLLEGISEECGSQSLGSVTYQFKALGIFFDTRRESCRSSEIGNPCESSAVCNTSNVGSSLCALCTGAWGRQLPLDDVEQGLTPEDCAGRKGVVWAMQQASKEAQESILQAVSCEAQRNLGVPRKALQDGRVGEEQGMRTAQPLASLRPGFSVPALSWFSPTSSILDF